MMEVLLKYVITGALKKGAIRFSICGLPTILFWGPMFLVKYAVFMFIFGIGEDVLTPDV